jgi:hypothetical protein
MQDEIAAWNQDVMPLQLYIVLGFRKLFSLGVRTFEPPLVPLLGSMSVPSMLSRLAWFRYMVPSRFRH